MPDKYKFNDSVGYLTTTVSRKLQQRLLASFTSTGLNVTPDQWRVLVVIFNEGEMYQSQLAASQKKDRAGVKRLVDHLESKGLVLRKPSGNDARTNIVALTEEGLRVVQILNNESYKTLGEALSCFDESEVVVLRSYLNKLLENIK